MKKINLLAIFGGLMAFLPSVAMAVYPVYNNGQMQQGYYPTTANSGVYPTTIQSGAIMPNSYTTVATSANRVTGQLPQVGSNASNAGRQYYMPGDYDRLADSGLYIGLGVAYSASIMGEVSADYKNETNAFFVPGAFEPAPWETDTVIPLQVSVGAAINNDVRVDFSFSRYSGIEYPSNVLTSDGVGGTIQTDVTGGAITASSTMLNVYYNIDSYTGLLMGGAMRPYIGAGLGLGLNTIADYVVYDATFYSENDPALVPAGTLTGISDIYSYHNGGTTELISYMLEGGVSTELEGGMMVDFFVRYTGLGSVKTSGSIVVSQTEWLADGAGGEYAAPYDSVFHYTNWSESGDLGTVDIGARLRLQF